MRWPLLLVVPFAGLICGPLYAARNPELIGVAFFYWYELACVLVAAGLSWLVYRPKSAGKPAAPREEPRFARDPAIRRRPTRPVTRAR